MTLEFSQLTPNPALIQSAALIKGIFNALFLFIQ